MSYRCTTCGEVHEGLPDIGLDEPDYYWSVPEAERDKRVKLTSDTCVIDDEDFFIRGVLEIPVLDYPQTFGFGVWVSQKRENFQTYLDNWDSAEIGPFFGWLSTRLNYYKDDTLLLKTMAHFRSGGRRPSIEVGESEHQLSIDQRDGITLAKAWEIVHFYLDSEEKGV
ncbi:MAG TPA: DUF2199 domain-containing protein [Blastocatellia bacterium]|nr:DUF2199 domain-containing protein [Blastocatellia bacterium]